MSKCSASLVITPAAEQTTPVSLLAFQRMAHWVMLLAAVGIPLSLLWDFSWESTVGIDLLWSPPHAATYLAVALAGMTALGLVIVSSSTRAGRADAVRLGGLYGPLGAWLAFWGALAFLVSVLFDRWWQSAYGLAAGIWHPPQISKAVAFFAVLCSAWLLCVREQNLAGAKDRASAVSFSIGGGIVMAMISVIMLVLIYANRQHSAWFFCAGCATYPIVLVALTTAGKLRYPATVGAVAYMALAGMMVWLLPLFPATPLTGPIYNRLDHLMAPPFPLLLIVPAVASDWLLRQASWPAHRFKPWLQAGAVGFALAFLFIATQWVFSEFLLTNLADNWFFAGGGKHWPFFLKISSDAKLAFWHSLGRELDWSSTLIAMGLSMLGVRLGLWLGGWMTRLRR